MDDKKFNDIFGNDNITHFSNQFTILESEKQILFELNELNKELRKSFAVELSLRDYLISGIAGIMLGLANALFKSRIPKIGKKHNHGTRRTAIDYKSPKPNKYKDSVQSLHRQIGPGHDIFRFKEALELMSGEKKDFPLWGSSLAKRTGGLMHPGGMSIDSFLLKGGFRIPDDPKKELINHLLIDFFTKTSLPVPGTSFITDKNEFCAKIMLEMYDDGFNLKNLAGNSLSVSILQAIMHSYAFLFKALPRCEKLLNVKNPSTIIPYTKELLTHNKNYLKSNEFHIQQMIAHGSSFLIDSAITTGSQNYAGIFALNYASLLIFIKHSAQYTINGYTKYKFTKSKINLMGDELLDINEEWYNGFRNNVIQISETKNFQRIIEPELDKVTSENVHTSLSNINTLTNNRIEKIMELNDWSDFNEEKNK